MSEPASDAAACRAVLVSFLAAIDHGRAAEALDLFTDDAELDALGQELRGRSAIREFLDARQHERDRHTAHLLANDLVHQITNDEIEISAMLYLYERQPGGGYSAERVLDTRQRFRRTEAGWRICSRITRPVHPVAY